MVRRRHRISAFGIGIVVAALAAGCGSSGGSSSGSGSGATTAQGVTANSISIGIPGPLTGPASFVGLGFQAGANFAAQQINSAGGINGRTVKFDVIDTKADPAAGVTALRKMIQQDKDFAILSAQTSTETVAAAPLLRQTKIPYISLASDDSVFTPFAANLFSGSSTREAVKAAQSAQFVSTLGIKTMAITVGDDAHSQAGSPIFEKAVEASGIQIVAKTDHSVADTSFTSQVSKMIAAHPDAIYIYSLGTSAGHLLQQIRAQGYTGKVIGDSGTSVPDVINIAGKAAAEGFYASWFPTTDAPGDPDGNTAKFDTAFATAVPDAGAGLPNIYTYMGYQDMYVLAEGIRGAGKNLTWDSLIASMDKMNNFVAGTNTPQWPNAIPIGTPRTFTATNHAGSTWCMEVIVHNGQFQSVPK
jgi:ABC-type branched-subunit amino acid transport system substrate-binding protein